MVKWRYEGGPEGQNNENLALRNLWTTPKEQMCMQENYNPSKMKINPLSGPALCMGVTKDRKIH